MEKEREEFLTFLFLIYYVLFEKKSFSLVLSII